MLFSSGWENPHRVGPVTKGERFALVMFFSTEPPAVESCPEWESSNGDSLAGPFWRMGIYPEKLEDFLMFMQHWAIFFADGDA